MNSPGRLRGEDSRYRHGLLLSVFICSIGKFCVAALHLPEALKLQSIVHLSAALSRGFLTTTFPRFATRAFNLCLYLRSRLSIFVSIPTNMGVFANCATYIRLTTYASVR